MAETVSQKYTATVEVNWSSEVFDGDPDDVYELAELEKEFLHRLMITTVDSLDPDHGTFVIKSVEPVLGDK